MKTLIKAAFIFTAAAVLYSCEKSNDVIEESTTPTGVGYYPISNNAIQDFNITPARSLSTTSGSATAYAGGANIKAEVTFFSQSPVKQTVLYNTIGSGTKTAVATIPYTPSFSTLKGVDTVMVNYTVPTAPAANTVIRLDFEVENVNALKVVRTVYIRKT
jgi:hypothetical protein